MRFPKVGFDIDGVFLSDTFYSGDQKLKDYLLQRCEFLFATFEPEFPFYAVTGRLNDRVEKHLTEYWFEMNFANQPIEIFHNDEGIQNAVKFKEKVINREQFDIFFESDLNQYRHLKENCKGTKIVHFATLINEAISDKIFELFDKGNKDETQN